LKDVFVVRDLFHGQEASLGTCIVYDGDKQLFKSESLERAWLDNANNISCIPVGTYPLVLEHSPRFRKDLWEVKEVPGRAECKFHASNYWHQLNGCIALGNNRKDIDGDKVQDVTSSRKTMDAFHLAMGDDTKANLHIIDLLNLV